MKAALAICTIAAIAIAAGCGADEGSDSSTTSAATVMPIAAGTAQAVLRPVGGATARGGADYVKKPDETRLIRLHATGFEPASGQQQYAVWQKHSRDDMVLLATWRVGDNGRLVETWEPNSASLRFLEDGTRTKLLITRVGDISRLSEAKDSYDHIYIGEPVLEGTFTGSLVGARLG